MPFNMGPGEILLIFLLVIILFGAKRLPDLARSLGKSIKEFKHATQGLRDELDINKVDERPQPPPSPKKNDEPQAKNSEERQKSEEKSK